MINNISRKYYGKGYIISTVSAALPYVIMCEDDYETAIIVDDKYYILNGDWHDKFVSCGSLKECLDLFLANKERISSWSNELCL